MRKILTILSALALGLMSCANPSDSGGEVTINGTWTLDTVQGVPAAAIPMSEVITVTGGNTFSSVSELSGQQGSGHGTVVLKSGSVYTFTAEGAETGQDYTLSSNGKTLTAETDFFGTMVYKK